MKKQESLNIAGAFETKALRVLRAIPDLTVVSKRVDAGRETDATVRFAGKQTVVAIEFKSHANAATAWQLVQRSQARPKPPLMLIAGETTAEARKILADHGISAIDALGNAHIQLPGLLFHLEGRRKARGTGTKPLPRLRGKAGVVAQALLVKLDRTWAIHELASEAQVSAGLTHSVLARLEREGLVAATGNGPRRVRRVTNPAALLDLWAEESTDHPTLTLGHLLAQTHQQLLTSLCGNLARRRIDYALTGAAAASLVAPLTTGVPIVEIWVKASASADELYKASGAEPVIDGQNVVFLQATDDAPLAFRERASDSWVVNRFRLYLDLRRDPRRGREQADHLRREVIGF